MRIDVVNVIHITYRTIRLRLPRVGRRFGRLRTLADPPRVGTERPHPASELGEVDDGAAALEFVATGSQVRVEHVLPWKAARRPRLELREIDVAQRENAERLEESPGSVVERECNRCFVRVAERFRVTADQDETGDVVGKVLDAGLKDLQTEEFSRAG